MGPCAHAQPPPRDVAVPRLAGALVGTPVGILYVAPLGAGVTIKLMFATLLCSFDLLHLRRIGEIIDYHGITPTALPFHSTAGFSVGLLGSMIVASITGGGAGARDPGAHDGAVPLERQDLPRRQRAVLGTVVDRGHVEPP